MKTRKYHLYPILPSIMAKTYHRVSSARHCFSSRFLATIAWRTGKPCERTRKSHINVCVYDSTWEASDSFALENSDEVLAWAKNDHLGFEVLYIYRGVVRKYRPDFLARLRNGEMLVLETKGRDTEQDKVKHRCLDEWTKAVNAHGGFGLWRSSLAMIPGEIQNVLKGE